MGGRCGVLWEDGGGGDRSSLASQSDAGSCAPSKFEIDPKMSGDDAES